jgi:hypothetical protein
MLVERSQPLGVEECKHVVPRLRQNILDFDEVVIISETLQFLVLIARQSENGILHREMRTSSYSSLGLGENFSK